MLVAAITSFEICAIMCIVSRVHALIAASFCLLLYVYSYINNSSSSSSSGVAFTAWLPTFYEAVADMLHDEQRRVTELFGSSTTPTVLCALLLQTFQPITSSYAQLLCDSSKVQWTDAIDSMSTALHFVVAALEQVTPPLTVENR
jgi:hypothetical protein